MYHSSFSCVHLAAQENFRTCALIHELPALLHSARARASMKLGGGARSLENTKASVVWQSGSPYPRGYNRTYRSTRCGAPSTIGLRVRSSPFRLASFERREDSRLFDPTSSPYGTQLARWISTAIKRGSPGERVPSSDSAGGKTQLRPPQERVWRVRRYSVG